MSRNVGGRVDLRINGQVYHLVADLEFEESDIEVEAVTNQDGTVGRSVKTKPFKAETKIRDTAGLNINALMHASFDASFVEREMNRSVLLTGAFFSGTPRRNTVNGEISGLTMNTDSWRVA